MSINNNLFAQPLSLDSVYTIWEEAPHNAFPLLIYFNDYCYVSFREGEAHAGDEGKIRVIRSMDLHNWESVILISVEGYDLREGHFSILPDGRLHLSYTGWNLDNPYLLDTFFITTADGIDWSDPVYFPFQNHWLYGLTWYNNIGYSLADYWGDVWSYFLFVTEDGENFSILDTLSYVDNEIDLLHGATEADILFDNDGHLWATIRFDSNIPLVLADSTPPLYSDWQIRAIEHEGNYSPSLGRPELIRLPNENVILGTRVSGNQTGIYNIDLESATTSIALILPSGGDTGYIDIALHNEEIQAVYYSTHEDTITRIYFAHIDYVSPMDIYKPDIPKACKLYQNYPNPFNSYTNITYNLLNQSLVTITIYNILGKQITKLINTRQSVGFKAVRWDGTNNMGDLVSSGTYIYKIDTGKFTETGKMILMK